MDKKQIVEYLKSNLKIKINFKESECCGKELTVSLLLDNEIISEDTNDLSNFVY